MDWWKAEFVLVGQRSEFVNAGPIASGRGMTEARGMRLFGRSSVRNPRNRRGKKRKLTIPQCGHPDLQSSQSSASKIGALDVVEEETLAAVSIFDAVTPIPFSEALPIAFSEAGDVSWNDSRCRKPGGRGRG